MKGDPKILDKLNFLLADELTAVNQYMVEAEMCDNWGYKALADIIEKRAIDHSIRIRVIAAKQLGVHPCHPFRCELQSLARRVFAHGF